MTADEQLHRRLEGLEGDAAPRADVTVLIAINDGRLADFTFRHRDRYGWIARETDRAFDPSAPLTPGGVWLVDLKRRSFVGLPNDPHGPSLMRHVLARLVEPERWSIRGSCVAQHECPIRHNAERLRSSEVSSNNPAGRLEHLLRLAHLRGQKHLTMRDLRSGLAYLITAGQTCADVHTARRDGQTLPAEYWQAVFTTPADTDVMLGELRPLDPARSPQPFLERYLFFHREPSDAPIRRKVFNDAADLPFDGADPVAWLADVKRRLFFHGALPTGGRNGVPSVPWTSLLPYRLRSGTFLNEIGGYHEPDTPPKLLKGLGRSEGLTGDILNDGLCLKVAHSDENRLSVLKLFPATEFTLAVEPLVGTAMVESIPMALILSHRSGARLRIPIDLFDTLLRLADGQEPDAPELQPLLEDLLAFKARLHHHQTRDLILIENNRRRHLLTQRDGKVVREDWRPPDRAQRAETAAPTGERSAR